MRQLCIVSLCAGILAALASGQDGSTAPVVRPEAKAQTDPVPHGGDAADDPAIWLHPTEPEKSLILGTDKQGALHVYDMDGSERQRISEGSRPNNVDVIYGLRLGDRAGREVDLAVATVRAAGKAGVKVWRIDADQRLLTDVTENGVIRVFGGMEPYGICTYRSARTGRGYFFVNAKDGRFEQCELIAADRGRITGLRVRTFKIASQPEGCVADDELGHLYVGEENAGIWKFAAEPNAGDERKRIAKVGEHGLTADVEGLTIYAAANGKGYLIASSQGNNTFKVYTRDGDNRFVLTIDPKAGRLNKPIDTDGIAVTNRPTSRQFPKGFLIVQDGHNKGGNQNFKFYAWEDIAGDRLIVDPSWDPRPRRR